MSDFAQPADKPGRCPKCRGSGLYSWGAIVNGRPSKSGQCHSCGGTGRQTRRDILRNNAYNRYKLQEMV